MRLRKLLLWFGLCASLFLGCSRTALGEVTHIRFQSVQQINWAVAVSDTVFAASGQTYSQPAAQASLGMALSAFRIPDVALANRGDNINAYLTELGFSQISLQEYDVQPTMQTIGSAIAMKPMRDAGGAFTLLAVAISGGGYQDEWKSNFLIGNGLHHEGFDYAAKQVYHRLNDYIARQGVYDRVKVWVAGYSRAAATANRLAAILLDNRAVTADNLFCYTFATPNVTRQQDAAAYPSIFNTVGSFDPVPMIPFEEWGYTRFGVTRYLPTPETNSDYPARVEPVKALYRQMTGQEYWINQSDNRLMQKVFGVLTNMVSNIDDYADHYQNLLIDLWSRKNNPLSLLTGLVQTLTSDQTLWEQLSGQADQALAIVSNTAGEALLQDVGLFQQSWRSDTGLAENLMHEHYPKGYLAWMFAYGDENAMASENRLYRQVLVGGDAGLEVYDQSGTLVCSYNLDNGVPMGQSAETSLTISQSGDALWVSIPADEPYRVEITARQGDPVDFVLREGTIGSIRMNEFQLGDAALPIGVKLTCALPQAFATDGTRYTLLWQGGQAECLPADTAATANNLEFNSTAKQLLGENLLALLGIALMVLVELLFLLTVAVRALRRHRHKVRIRRTLPGPAMRVTYHRLRFSRRQRLRGIIKVCGLLLLAAAATALTQAIQTAVVWVTQYRSINQATLLWYMTLMSIPLVLPPLLASLPALFSALYALFWPEEDTYALKTSRYFAIFALPCTGVLLYVLTSEAYRGVELLLFGSTAAQAVLLALLCVLAFVALLRHPRALKPSVAQAETPEASTVSQGTQTPGAWASRQAPALCQGAEMPKALRGTATPAPAQEAPSPTPAKSAATPAPEAPAAPITADSAAQTPIPATDAPAPTPTPAKSAETPAAEAPATLITADDAAQTPIPATDAPAPTVDQTP